MWKRLVALTILVIAAGFAATGASAQTSGNWQPSVDADRAADHPGRAGDAAIPDGSARRRHEQQYFIDYFRKPERDLS